MSEEFLKNLLGTAFNMGKDAEFIVSIDSDKNIESSIMSYIELGTFLITNVSMIEKVYIRLKEV